MNNPNKPSFFEALLGSLWSVEKSLWKDSLWVALVGAIIVGLVFAVIGAYFFGLYGFGIGLLVGAVIGGIGLFLLYHASSLFT